MNPNNWEFTKYNIRNIIEFIRWKELIFLVSTLIIGYIFFHWWGIGIALILDFLNHMGGGVTAGSFPEPDRKKPCSENVKDCEYCGNGYSHEFNLSYDKKHKKWYNLF